MTILANPSINKLISLCVIAISVPSFGWARSDLDNRVSRLENIVASELNAKLLNELEVLQQEVRELRGKLEEQQNSMQNLNTKQEKLYLNLDNRLNKLDSAADPATTEAATAVATPVTSTPVVPTVTQSPVASPDVLGTSEKSLYENANNLLLNGKYAEAIIEFKDLLWQFPEGTYAQYAYYWLGEIYSLQWHENPTDKNLLAQAKEAFATITQKYKGYEREADAWLKLALLEVEQDHLAVARDLLQNVINKYPNTAIAKVAESNLVRIDRTQIEYPSVAE